MRSRQIGSWNPKDRGEFKKIFEPTTLINQLISRVKGEISSFIGVEKTPESDSFAKVRGENLSANPCLWEANWLEFYEHFPGMGLVQYM